MTGAADGRSARKAAPDPTLFDLAREYDEMLARGLRFSGESREFFLRGRVADLVKALPVGERPDRILDFGCGLGDTTAHLAQVFAGAEATGVDTARGVLDHASREHAGPRVAFEPLEELAGASYDLCYVNGVFHHIEPGERGSALRTIREALRPGGWLAFFENNPWNVATRFMMRRVPFDKDARLISPPRARRLLRAHGFQTRFPTRYLFFFPRLLRWLRPLEGPMRRVPLGGQYLVLANTPAAGS